MSHSAMNGVRRISPVEALNDKPQHERVVSGEVLSRETTFNQNSSERSGFTFDQRKESHPGFYPKHEVLGQHSKRAINSYRNHVNAGIIEQQNASRYVDYFV